MRVTQGFTVQISMTIERFASAAGCDSGRLSALHISSEPAIDLRPLADDRFGAGWSSPVARQAHNLKVVGSNPTPATNSICSAFFFGERALTVPVSDTARRGRRRKRLQLRCPDPVIPRVSVMFARVLRRVGALIVALPLVLGSAVAQDADSSSAAAQDTESSSAAAQDTDSSSAAAQDADSSSAAAQDTEFSKEELDQLLAPIALYSDDLLSSVLMASTYPLEVVQAARWVKVPANAKLKGDALAKALEDQDWDPSIKSLTQFPEVLEMMSDQLEWTEKLGDAVLAQEPDVMDQIQYLRDKADEAGNLKSNEQQTVSKKSSDGKEYIYIEPASPEVVYVPVYEPVVYGSWWYPSYPPYYWGAPVGGAFVSGVFWGAGVAVASSIWGWGNVNWGRGNININVNKYNRINVNRTKITSNRWQHNSYHRRGVKYNNNNVRKRYSKNDIRAGQNKRLDYRGRGGKQVLKPGGDRRPGAGARPGDRPNVGGGKRPGGPNAGGGKRPSAGDKKRPSTADIKRPSAGAGKRPSSGAAKRPSSGARKSKGNSAFSKPKKQSNARKHASRGRSSMGGSRGGSRSHKGGGGRGGGRGGGGRRR